MTLLATKPVPIPTPPSTTSTRRGPAAVKAGLGAELRNDSLQAGASLKVNERLLLHVGQQYMMLVSEWVVVRRDHHELFVVGGNHARALGQPAPIARDVGEVEVAS